MKKHMDSPIISLAKAFVYRRLLARHPTLCKIVRAIQYYAWRGTWKVRHVLHAAATYDPDEILWVDPKKIVNCVALDGSTYTIRGLVAGGDWDTRQLPFEHHPLYKAFVARFSHGASWESTQFYKDTLSAIERGQAPWMCSTKEAFLERLTRIEALYHEIRTQGYKSQSQLPKSDIFARDPGSPFKKHDEVVICIGRHGDLLFRDGKHRLAIAKILNLPVIPVAVGLRHQQWHRFRQEVLEYARSNGGKVYHPLTHPDLRTVPAQHDDRRFELMTQYLPRDAKTLLDLGSHWGYFCHRFEELGLECTAVESHPKHIYFLQRLRRAEGRRFAVIDTPLEKLDGPQRYDVILALNIFHHFLKTRAMFESLLNFVRRIDAKIMFFETALPVEPIMRDAELNLSPDDFTKLLLENSCFAHCQAIGRVAKGRPLYIFYR